VTYPTVPSFDDALAERDRVLEQVNNNADEIAKQTVDQAILSLAALRPTSANDFRDKLPEIGDRSLIGARFRSLLMQKRLVRVGEVVSTDPGTHAKRIGLYVTPTIDLEREDRISDPDCWSCGDRPLGCPRCTDMDGEKR
jgi:hypothetical protein